MWGGLCQLSDCHSLGHHQFFGVSIAPTNLVCSPLALYGVEVGILFPRVTAGELLEGAMLNPQLFTTLSVVERLRGTSGGVDPVAVHVTSDVTVHITNHRGDPQMSGTKRRHAATVDQLTNSLTILVVLSQNTPVALQVAIVVAVGADDAVVRKLVADPRASAHGCFWWWWRSVCLR
jgi:hypothetical protein